MLAFTEVKKLQCLLILSGKVESYTLVGGNLFPSDVHIAQEVQAGKLPRQRPQGEFPLGVLRVDAFGANRCDLHCDLPHLGRSEFLTFLQRTQAIHDGIHAHATADRPGSVGLDDLASGKKVRRALCDFGTDAVLAVYMTAGVTVGLLFADPKARGVQE